MKRSRPVSLALAGLFLWVTGCTSYKLIHVSETSDHAKVRVTLRGGERETLHNPRVEGDSIRSGDTHPIPLDEVIGLEAVGMDEIGTIFTALGFIALALFASCAASSCLDNP